VAARLDTGSGTVTIAVDDGYSGRAGSHVVATVASGRVRSRYGAVVSNSSDPGRDGDRSADHPPEGPADVGSAAPQPGRAARPRTVIVAVVLLIAGALPFLGYGAYLLVTAEPVPPRKPPWDPYDTGFAHDMAVLLRVVVVVVMVAALLYVVAAVFAFLGRWGARVALTIMTIIFTLPLFWAILIAASQSSGLVVIPVVLLGLSVGGTVLLYTPAAARFLAGGRVRLREWATGSI